MNKREGFSLVELIISLVIIAAIGLVIGVNFNKIFSKEEGKSYDEYRDKIKSAANAYLSYNPSLLSELNTNRSFVKIELKDLKEAGYISTDLINPQTGLIYDDYEVVLVSLDESGVVKFTYPAEKTEEHLQTLNKIINYGEDFDCFDGLNTINLGLMKEDGSLDSNYFVVNSDKITCDKDKFDRYKIGKYIIRYSYENSKGVTKEATRNVIVIDSIFPSINITANPDVWTNYNVIITATIIDNESKVAAYAINQSSKVNEVSWMSISFSPSKSISKTITTNGKYYVWGKDGYGNITKEEKEISNIDKIPPSIANIDESSSSCKESLIISTTITDNESGIVAYAINQSSNVNNVSWTNILISPSKSVSKTITANGTYYFWGKDVAGNVNYKEVTINNICLLKTAYFMTEELSSSTYDGEYDTGFPIKGIESGYEVLGNGNVSSITFSGSKISYYVEGGQPSYKQGGNEICSVPADYQEISSSYECTGEYVCPLGYDEIFDEYSCVRTVPGPIGAGKNYYVCGSDGKWFEDVELATENVICDPPESKVWGCDPAPTGTCFPGDTKTIDCWGRCPVEEYSSLICSTNTYENKSEGYYYCSDDSYTLNGPTCERDCTPEYSYWQYEIHINYYVSKP